jgi:hypothetical protein
MDTNKMGKKAGHQQSNMDEQDGQEEKRNPVHPVHPCKIEIENSPRESVGIRVPT